LRITLSEYLSFWDEYPMSSCTTIANTHNKEICMELKNRHCNQNESELLTLSNEKEEQFAREISGWEIVRNGEHTLSKMIQANSFRDAVYLIQDIAEVAENENHHPDLHLYYSKLKIELVTHKVHGLTENDFIMAAKIDDLVQTKE
jgi:4a-hydroxytetrahydrobiopterin dehydratase